MIEIGADELIPLGDVSRLLPPRRGGKRPSFACILKWTRQGCRGQRLETIRIGSTLCTTKTALEDFFRALTEDDKTSRMTRQSQREIEKVDEMLRQEGLL